MPCCVTTVSRANALSIQLVLEEGADSGALSHLAERWGLVHDPDAIMALVLTPEHLELRKLDEPKLGAILSILSPGPWRIAASLAAAVVKQWQKPWVSKAAMCRALWMRPQD